MFRRIFPRNQLFPLAHFFVYGAVYLRIPYDTTGFAVKPHDFGAFTACNTALLPLHPAFCKYILGEIRVCKKLPPKTR